MGWSKGKGLGAKMDGDQNFIRISHKADQKGIGYSDRDDQWTAHENQFNSLLKSLDEPEKSEVEHEGSDNDAAAVGAFCGFGFGSSDKSKKKKKKDKDKSNKAKLSGKSLEEMSKSSGVRVHYRKFTRGKDTSRYSEKDLANIFGKKVTDDEEPQEAEETNDTKENDDVELNYGITTIETGTTISDYFNKKKTKKSKKDVCADEDVEPEPKPNGSTSAAEVEATEVIDVDTLPDEQTRKKKKKKKRTRSEAAIDEEEVITIAESPPAADVEKDKKKKKKKKKNKEKERESADETVNLDETVITLLDDDSMEVNDVVVEKPPKAKKRKKNATANDDTEVTSTDHHQPIENSAFFKHILDTILTVNPTSSGTSSTELNESATVADEQTRSVNAHTGGVQPTPIFAETYELNRYQAEMFRFVDLAGFPNANISDLSGYGFSKNIDLKITAKSQDHSRINDLWDYALINKYGKDVIRTKKKQRYSVKALKKKSLFKAL